MPGEPKCKVCVVAPSNTVKRVIAEYNDDQAFVFQFVDPKDLETSDLACDIFVVDHVLFAERNCRMKERLMATSPSALTLGLVCSGDEGPDLGDLVDWSVSYADLRRGINEAIKVAQVIRRKAARGLYFDEMLAVSRIVKHDACNALAIACGAAGRLAKVPGVAECAFYKLLVESHDKLTAHLEQLGEIQEKHRSKRSAAKEDE